MMNSNQITGRKKVLILALSGIGNFIMQSPVFSALKLEHPDWRLTVWVAPRGTKTLAENNQYIDEVIEAPISVAPWHHFLTTLELVQKRFDIGLVMSPGQLIKSASYLYAAGVKERIGHTYPFRGNGHSHALLTRWVDENDKLHDIEQNLALLALLGITSQQKHYSLDVPQSYQQQANLKLSQLGLTNYSNLVGFHLGSAKRYEWKRWPLANFVTVGRELIAKKQAHIFLFGGSNEEGLKQAAQEKLGAGATVISEELLTVAAMMQRCRLVLSNDSGLMHLAAASGVPTVGLFGPTNEVQTGPRGIKSKALRASGTRPVYNTENNFDLGHESHPAMVALSPAMVLDGVNEYLL